MDMGLIRIVSNLSGRQLILFVNRIDELSDPASQIPEIRDNMQETLRKFAIDMNATIIFGSAKWAEAALTGSHRELPDDSKKALIDWAHHAERYVVDDALAHIWHLSGIPELLNAIATRAADGKGRRILEKARRQGKNIANQVRATASVAQCRLDGDLKPGFDGQTLKNRVLLAEQGFIAEITVHTEKLHSDLVERMKSAELDFVQRSTRALVEQLNRYGEIGTWECDATLLRTRLKAAYSSFGRQLKTDIAALFARATEQVEKIYGDALEGKLQDFRIQPPSPPRAQPPVVLARTIALDLNRNWWQRWWHVRRGYETYADDYRRLITEEVRTIREDLDCTQVAPMLDATCTTLRDFFDEHKETLFRIADQDNAGAEALDKMFREPEQQQMQARVEDVLKTLEKLAAQIARKNEYQET